MSLSTYFPCHCSLPHALACITFRHGSQPSPFSAPTHTSTVQWLITCMYWSAKQQHCQLYIQYSSILFSDNSVFQCVTHVRALIYMCVSTSCVLRWHAMPRISKVEMSYYCRLHICLNTLWLPSGLETAIEKSSHMFYNSPVLTLSFIIFIFPIVILIVQVYLVLGFQNIVAPTIPFLVMILKMARVTIFSLSGKNYSRNCHICFDHVSQSCFLCIFRWVHVYGLFGWSWNLARPCSYWLPNSKYM